MFKVAEGVLRHLGLRTHKLGVQPVSRRTIMYSLSSIKPDEFKSVQYTTKDKVAYITLNRPHVLNAINPDTVKELYLSVMLANDDDNIKVMVLSGSGKAFSSGYDLRYAEKERGALGSQKMPWDPYIDYKFMGACTEAFMSLWKSYKPTLCKVHGYAVAGGSDLALCCDMVVMGDNARIGYPPARVWGCPTTAMWVYRIGAEKAKRMLFTGDLIDGKEAARIGLVLKAVPEEQLDDEVERLAKRMVNVPSNQLFFQKQVINQAIENMGLSSTQRLATFFDGMSRHTPEGVQFQQRAAEVGFKKAVLERDSGDDTLWSGMNSKL
ncbi:putative enoyl-CoA hydratase isoform X2 [Ptychodera flava]|uniref:putative enoyl-CoA hydratase isoform X2 n=2 Tax=Ptychodera flava TaxID=63121 RepID=UPI00396A0C70